MNEQVKAGADIHAGDGGYSIGTQEHYEEFERKRNRMNKQQLAAVKQAMEALKECRCDPRLKYEHPFYDKVITDLEQAIAQDALDWMAKNARELGLDYKPAPVQEPSFKEWTQDYVRNNIHKLKSTPPAASKKTQP
jgi:hypothetical protein